MIGSHLLCSLHVTLLFHYFTCVTERNAQSQSGLEMVKPLYSCVCVLCRSIPYIGPIVEAPFEEFIDEQRQKYLTPKGDSQQMVCHCMPPRHKCGDPYPMVFTCYSSFTSSTYISP